MDNIEAFSFDDVLLVPGYSELKSRQDVDLSTMVGDYGFKLPIISAPMDTVTGLEMAKAMGKAGGLGILHRYMSMQEQCEALMAMEKDGEYIRSVAIGVTGDDWSLRLSSAIGYGADLLCIDVAHAHHSLVADAIKRIKKLDRFFPLLVGNIATAEAYHFLADLDVGAVKVGIGSGSICSTRLECGHGVPQLYAVMEVAKARAERKKMGLNCPSIVSDGGIRRIGDIVKALAAGADAVMLGSMLAGTDESPGEVKRDIVGYANPNLIGPTFAQNPKYGPAYKEYRGMASVEAQMAWKGEARSQEGIAHRVPHKGPVGPILDKIAFNLRSGFSYSGAANLAELHAKAKFIRTSPLSSKESDTHILHASW